MGQRRDIRLGDKFIALSATEFKHAAFVGLPAVILALGAVD
jgi:hypothetical protein